MHQKMCANWLCVFQINFCEATCVLTRRKGATSSDRKQKRSLIGWEWLCFWSEDSQQVNWFSVCSLQLQLREYTRKQDTAKYFHHSILKIFCFFYSLLYCKKLSCCKCLITFFVLNLLLLFHVPRLSSRVSAGSVASGECSLATSWGRCLAGGCFTAGSSKTPTLLLWKASTCCQAPSRPRSCVPSLWRKVSTLR